MAADPEDLAQVRRLVVHDVRSPLAVILGQCDLLGMRGNLTDADASSVRSIERAAQGVLELVDRAGDLLRAAGIGPDEDTGAGGTDQTDAQDP